MTVYREARPGDAEAIARLHAKSWRETYRGEFPDAFLDGDLFAERLSVWLERLEKPPHPQFVLLALEGTELLGFVCAYGAHDTEWGSLIDNLHVAKSAKRSGIGTSLMRRAGVWLAETHPTQGVYLWVLESNISARRFYERLGARNAGVSTMEVQGGAIVRSCRYVWSRAEQLAVFC